MPKSTFLLGFYGAVIISDASAQEDPARFLVATNWNATFTRALHANGSYPSDMLTYGWSFSHDGSFTTEFNFQIINSAFEGMWTDLLFTNRTLGFVMNDQVTQTSGGSTFVSEAHKSPSMRVDAGGSFLTVSVASNTYTLSALGYGVKPYIRTDNGVPVDPGDDPVHWFPHEANVNGITEPLPTNGMVLEGRREYSLAQLELAGGDLLLLTSPTVWSPFSFAPQALQGTLVITWTLSPVGIPNLKITALDTPFSANDLHSFVSTDQIALKAQVTPALAGSPVKWTVVGQGAASGISGFPSGEVHSTDAQGISTFTFKPSDNGSFVRDRQTGYTTASRQPNKPISFEVIAELQSVTTLRSRLSQTTLGLLQQDETDVLRQEYVDFSIPVPSRSDVVPSLGGYFNGGPYGVQLSADLPNHYNAILNAYRGSTITVNGQSVGIPQTAPIQVTCGFRSPRINKAVGSILRDSRHMRGRALDLKPIVFDVVVNGRRTPVSLHGSLYPALQAAAATQGFAFAEQSARPVPLGDPTENHIHVEW
ncbi:MAG TPA: D-Ala-D-Ala carboxypeptidase family metallohydrolase [Candidatus Eisenbacteria bacterium]|nr:D-Ala-D-Ala carboxypeptidase family metallohydrolase [Candidatus Eisenbacteria bacterium]